MRSSPMAGHRDHSKRIDALASQSLTASILNQAAPIPPEWSHRSANGESAHPGAAHDQSSVTDGIWNSRSSNFRADNIVTWPRGMIALADAPINVFHRKRTQWRCCDPGKGDDC